MDGRRVKGLGFEPILNRIFVADYGQPETSEGGIIIGDSSDQFGRYRFSEWRYGEVLAVGPGTFNARGKRLPMPDLKVGEVVMFSRKHGTRLPGDMRYEHPRYGDLLIRVLDPDKAQAIVDGFVPWWNVQQSQLDPAGVMTG